MPRVPIENRFLVNNFSQFLASFSSKEKWLIALFLLSLPLANPWVRGDGVGYYAYARSILIEHRLDFTKDWQHGNESFTMGRLDQNGQVLPEQFTRTGHIVNLWSVGPSLLWFPFLLTVHAAILGANAIGFHFAADGFSRPYLVTMAFSTALYGFLGLWISFRLARAYFDESWAFLATVGVWWATSLPVYMYFNPSWSHAHSAFAVSIFLWYWHRTRAGRTWIQWAGLGLLSGLIVDVYYPNGVFLTIPLLAAFGNYRSFLKRSATGWSSAGKLFAQHVFYVSAFFLALSPTLISRRIIFGSALETGYFPARSWNWAAPHFGGVLFSSDHGLLSWTPILIFALIGLFLFARVDRFFGVSLLICCFLFYALIALYPDWDGLSSFGNRFFVSLTPAFVLGLAALFQLLVRLWGQRRATRVLPAATALLILWNLGLIFQWGTHLIPARGPISFRQAAYNQVAVVPREAAKSLKNYFTRRHQMMNQIERQDVNQLKSTPGTE